MMMVEWRELRGGGKLLTCAFSVENANASMEDVRLTALPSNTGNKDLVMELDRVPTASKKWLLDREGQRHECAATSRVSGSTIRAVRSAVVVVSLPVAGVVSETALPVAAAAVG